MGSNSDMQKEIERILKDERWRGFAAGKIEGALNVLYMMDLDKEERIELLERAVGVSRATASDYIDDKENGEFVSEDDDKTV